MNEIEKAIEALEEYGERGLSLDTIKIIYEALEAQQADRWVPVTEKLPGEYGTYMVAWRPAGDSPESVKIKTASQDTHFYEMLEYDPGEDNGWIETIKQCDNYAILAWKPLPKPWKDEQ